jgi:bifunctional ADP-heptose synthase (sugar kinase/adenylyltransferase)
LRAVQLQSQITLPDFSNLVTLVTGLGKVETHEDFIRSKLMPNVAPVFFYIDGTQTVTKRRFVDPDLTKLFEVYFFNEEPLLNDAEDDLCAWLEANLEKFDVVIVPDFGNGLISGKMVEILSRKARFLAVNTQVNSGNRGHHVITRYPACRFSPRLMNRNCGSRRITVMIRSITVAEDIGQKINLANIAVTRGANGVVFKDRKKGVSHIVPALSTKGS